MRSSEAGQGSAPGRVETWSAERRKKFRPPFQRWQSPETASLVAPAGAKLPEGTGKSEPFRSKKKHRAARNCRRPGSNEPGRGKNNLQSTRGAVIASLSLKGQTALLRVQARSNGRKFHQTGTPAPLSNAVCRLATAKTLFYDVCEYLCTYACRRTEKRCSAHLMCNNVHDSATAKGKK